MAKRALLLLSFFSVIVACIVNAACTGTPTNFNTVVLTPSALQVGPTGQVTITASVPKDTTGAGVTWTFTPGPGAPPSPGTFGPTTTTQALYTAPPSVAVQFTVNIAATSIAIPSESNSITITVTPPKPLVITTASLPDGVENKAYTTTQLQATGGVLPYTWSLASGSGPLPTGLIPLAADGTISGTPTATGTFNFTVQVTDSDTPPVVQTKALSITVTDLLTGNYAFEFSGFNSSGTVVVAGSFASDGLGNITGGAEDFNTIAGPPSGGTLETFTGTYTLGSDNRGTMTLVTSKSGTLVYAITVDSNGSHGRMVEFDSSGIRGSGELIQQNTTTCGSKTLSGNSGTGFVFGISGAVGSFTGITPGSIAMAGRFTSEVPVSSSTPGSIDNGEADANVPGILTTGQISLSGTFQTTSQAARCTMSISPSSLPTLNFSVYPVSSASGVLTEALIVETDTASASIPYITVGKMVQQIGYPFTNPSNEFTAPSVAGLSGNAVPSGGTNYLPFVALAELIPGGGGAFTMPLVSNFAGTVSNLVGGSAIAANLHAGDSFGRVDTNLVGGFVPVFYVINTNEAMFVVQNQDAAVIGMLEPQSAGAGATTFTANTIKGSLATGTAAPNTSVTTDFSGVITLDGTSVVGGTQDTSTSSANTPNQAVTGTYSITDTNAGIGSVTLTAPASFTGRFFIVSPTKVAMISTTAGDINPVLIFLGRQADDFGVN